MNTKRFGNLAIVLLVGLLVVAFAAIGCGDSSDDTATPAASGSAVAGGADQAHAQEQLAGLEALPTFEAAGPAFDAKAVMTGKSIQSIPGTGSDPFYVQMNKGMKFAADAVGYPFTVWNNQGQLTQYQQGFANGITKKVSLIDLLAGPDPNALKPQITEAQDAGILVVASHLSGIEQEVPNVDYNLPIDYKLAGQLLADWVITNDTTAHVLVVVSDEIVSTASMRDGISSEFDTYGGPDIQYTFVNVPIPEWGTKIKPAVQSAIVADPALTYVICIYDSMSQFVTPAIDATNSADKVKVHRLQRHALRARPGPRGQGRDVTLARASTGPAWAIADAEMRLIGDMGPVGEHEHPVPPLHQDNAAEAGFPAEFSKGYGDFRSEYATLWGL